MAGQDHRSRRAPPGGGLLSATRRIAACASKCDAICWWRARSTTATNLLRQIPSIGPIRAALLVALIQTPHRFRTKRQLWAYSGLALKTSISGEHRILQGQLTRSKKLVAIRGLNINHNHDLKNILKGAATRAAAVAGPFQEYYAASVARG